MISDLFFLSTATIEVKDSEETKSSRLNAQLVPKPSEVGFHFPLNVRMSFEELWLMISEFLLPYCLMEEKRRCYLEELVENSLVGCTVKTIFESVF